MSHMLLGLDNAFLKGVSHVSSFCLHMPGLSRVEPPFVRCGTIVDSQRAAAEHVKRILLRK